MFCDWPAELLLVDPVLCAVRRAVPLAEQGERVPRRVRGELVPGVDAVGLAAHALVGEERPLAAGQRLAPGEVVLVVPVEVDAEEQPATVGRVQRVPPDVAGEAGGVPGDRQQPGGPLVAAHGEAVEVALVLAAPAGAVQPVDGHSLQADAVRDAPLLVAARRRARRRRTSCPSTTRGRGRRPARRRCVRRRAGPWRARSRTGRGAAAPTAARRWRSRGNRGCPSTRTRRRASTPGTMRWPGSSPPSRGRRCGWRRRSPASNPGGRDNPCPGPS